MHVLIHFSKGIIKANLEKTLYLPMSSSVLQLCYIKHNEFSIYGEGGGMRGQER